MFAHDPYMAKSLEYLVGLATLGLFIVFWRWVNGGPIDVMEHAKAFAGQLSEWFRMPQGVSFHPGHAWVRREAPGIVAIGMDDFAQQLVGPISAFRLPAPGTTLREGTRAWALEADTKQIDMLAPATGTVVEVNEELLKRPDLVNSDPYGRGWLVKMRVPNLSEALAPLNAGARAKAWMDNVSRQLTAAMSPELGQLCQDGGMPVAGFARSIDEEHWDDVARTFLLTRDIAADRAEAPGHDVSVSLPADPARA
jgi:glycine cleavage system H protein